MVLDGPNVFAVSTSVVVESVDEVRREDPIAAAAEVAT